MNQEMTRRSNNSSIHLLEIKKSSHRCRGFCSFTSTSSQLETELEQVEALDDPA